MYLFSLITSWSVFGRERTNGAFRPRKCWAPSEGRCREMVADHQELPSGVPGCNRAWPVFVRVRPAAPPGSGVTFAARGLPSSRPSHRGRCRATHRFVRRSSAQGSDGDLDCSAQESLDLTLLILGLDDPAGPRDGGGEGGRMPMSDCGQRRQRADIGSGIETDTISISE
jgi:hypothetical protein